MPKLVLILIFSFQLTIFSQFPPKREFRGAWVATVAKIDWPKMSGTETQKAELLFLLDDLKETGINAVIFQVRPECDALYNSKYEPWSYWLTGTQGKAPSPYWDPLKFIIEQAHKRGMELHAWFNPYRAKVSSSSYPIAENHVTNVHPNWILKVGNDTVLDPGLPDVRNYIVDVISDVLENYDVDGIHMDDYFYPWSGITNEDSQTFSNYSRGITDIADWRRDNVNLMISAVYEAVNSIKPYVKFGMSPFGIWKNGIPSGISGTSAYGHPLYCDAISWLQNKDVDYLSPQLYWRFGGAQDYGKLLPWWASQINGRHLYVGQGAYRISSQDWPASEILSQIELNRSTTNCSGSIFFSTQSLRDNQKGIMDSLENNYFRNIALAPIMDWKDNIAPNAPLNLVYDRISDSGTAVLSWDNPSVAPDGDLANMFVIYASGSDFITLEDISNPEKIESVIDTNWFNPNVNLSSPVKFLTVTTLDRNSNESFFSNVIELNIPTRPLLKNPPDNTENLSKNYLFEWDYTAQTSYYSVQISRDSDFGSTDFVLDKVRDITFTLAELEGQEKYYWKVKGVNPLGEGDWSDIYSFTTGFPSTPLLLFPGDETINVGLQDSLIWQSIEGANDYHLQFSEGIEIDETNLLIDETGIKDNFYQPTIMQPNKIYAWRVSAGNNYGEGAWSKVFKFLTSNTTQVKPEEIIPSEYNLNQNYPNPFNNETIIQFSIPEWSEVKLFVTDILGKEISVLMNQKKNPGKYSVSFNADSLTSGVYIYTLQTQKFSISKKMVLVK